MTHTIRHEEGGYIVAAKSNSAWKASIGMKCPLGDACRCTHDAFVAKEVSALEAALHPNDQHVVVDGRILAPVTERDAWQSADAAKRVLLDLLAEDRHAAGAKELSDALERTSKGDITLIEIVVSETVSR